MTHRNISTKTNLYTQPEIGKIALVAEQLLSSLLNSLWDKRTTRSQIFLYDFYWYKHVRSHCRHFHTGWGITWVAKIVPIQCWETRVYIQNMFLYLVSDRWTKRDFCVATSSPYFICGTFTLAHILRHPYNILDKPTNTKLFIKTGK